MPSTDGSGHLLARQLDCTRPIREQNANASHDARNVRQLPRPYRSNDERAVRRAALRALAALAIFQSGVSEAGAFGEIPFELVRDVIVVKASLAGQAPCDVLLDTGADPSIVDLAFAKRSGMKLAPVGGQGDGGGTDQNLAYPTLLRDVRIGEITATKLDALALDLSGPSEKLGRKLCGVLGYSLFRGRIVEVDYPHRVVRFLARERATRNPLITLGFSYKNDILATGVSVNGKAVIANVDSGSNGDFQFSPAAVKRLSLEANVEAATPSESTGFNGKTENRTGTVGEIAVGPLVIPSPVATFYGEHTGRDDVAWDVRIGNAFLKNYIVTFNFQKDRIRLSPEK